jgi:hypothetical protein
MPGEELAPVVEVATPAAAGPLRAHDILGDVVSFPRRSSSASSRSARRPGLGLGARLGVRQDQAELHRAIAEDLVAGAGPGRGPAAAPPELPRVLELPEPPAHEDGSATSGFGSVSPAAK